MRVSTQPYKQTASNHIDAIRYNKDDRILTIRFYNGAVYEYLGVPLGDYEAMLQAPSHGAYLWDNIRGVFPYRQLGANSSTGGDIRAEILPELAKLDKLDQQERNLDKALRFFEITVEEHTALLGVISAQRDKLTIKLEKSGYFDEQNSSDEFYIEEGLEPLEPSIDYFSLVFGTIWAAVILAFKAIGLIFAFFIGLMAVMFH